MTTRDARDDRPSNSQIAPTILSNLEPVDRLDSAPIYSEITRRLLDYIGSGSIQPGARLPSERQLADELGVGRSHVRQAIKALVILGLVDVRQGDGTFLRRTDSPFLPLVIEWQLLLGAKHTTDLVEARHLLEVLIAGLAAERRDESDVAEMRRCVDIMERTTVMDEFLDADVAFHLQVARASGNKSLAQIMTSIRTLDRVWIRRVQNIPGTAGPTWTEHSAVLHAIEQRDPEAAREAMEAHMASATERLRVTLTENG